MIHPTADIEGSVGPGTRVWRWAHIRGVVGAGGVIGQSVYVDIEVTIGDVCKVENHACIYGPSVLGDGVFVGPHVCILNDAHPRAAAGSRLLERADWRPCGSYIETGASIGAGAIILPGLQIGRDAVVGAGAVVTRDVPRGVTVAGAPARQL
jgi:acetyltransferase-like isoleucine patch superfamily enzyme